MLFRSRWVIDRPRPAPVKTIFAPSRCASCAIPKASDASVSTPVMTIFFPSNMPTHSTVVGLTRFCLSAVLHGRYWLYITRFLGMQIGSVAKYAHWLARRNRSRG